MSTLILSARAKSKSSAEPPKPKEKLGWVFEISVEEMGAELAISDLEMAVGKALLIKSGHMVSVTED